MKKAENGIDWRQWIELLKPEGQQQIIDFIRTARDQRGENWLPEIEAEFPFASWIVQLVCTMDADAALDEIAKTYPLLPVKHFAGEHIKAFHGRLLLEIERPRDWEQTQ